MAEDSDQQRALAAYYAENRAIGALIYRAQKLGPDQLRRDARKLQAWELSELQRALVKLELDGSLLAYVLSPDLDDSRPHPTGEGVEDDGNN